jgi:hypothetical protein
MLKGNNCPPPLLIEQIKMVQSKYPNDKDVQTRIAEVLIQIGNCR